MSEQFHVTARKWRPMRFSDVVGQDHVTRTLKNSIKEGRLAHAYLFTGQRGCGKTTVARILAKAINCPNAKTNGIEPCNTCDICIAITEGRSMDVSEIDGASNNGVDDVRTMRDNVKYPPMQGEYKVIIIDEVHMLSTSAFNALLKTLEEPPKHLVFVFATTEVQKVLPTILSRTQRYDFRRMQLDEIIARLRLISDTDNIKVEDDALLVIGKKADGSMRDAQSIFDQVVAFCGKEIETTRVREALNLIDTDFFFDVSDAILEQDASRAFTVSHHVMQRGYDIEEFFVGLLEHFRNLLTAKLTSNAKLIEAAKVHQERYLSVAQELKESDILRLIRIGQNSLEALKTSQQPRIILEVALVEMLLMERSIDINSLLADIKSLKDGGGGRALNRVAEKPGTRKVSQADAARDAIAISEPEKPVGPSIKRSRIAETPAGELDAESIQSRWPELAVAVRSKNRLIGTIIADVEYVGLRRHVLHLAVGSREAFDILSQYKDVFTAFLREFYVHPQLSFELGSRNEMEAKADMPTFEKQSSTAANATDGSKLKSSGELSPIERKLVDDLKAHPVD